MIGARQIGKTTVIEQFGREQYENFVEINFVTDTDAHKIFAGNLDADTIVENLTAFKMQKMEPGNVMKKSLKQILRRQRGLKKANGASQSKLPAGSAKS